MDAGEQEYRDHVLEVALAQLAILFVEFNGFVSHTFRFDTLTTHKLRVQLAEGLAKFIAQTPVEAVDPELAASLRPGQHSIECRQVYIDRERTRLEEAGLVHPHLTAKED
jgi:hypothetical protein